MAVQPLENLEVKHTQLFINNEFVNSVDGCTFETLNPATGKKLADVQEAKKADVDNAVAAARAAVSTGSEWRKMDASCRGELIYKFAELISRDKRYLSTLESLDNGKTFNACYYGDLTGAVKTLKYNAGITDKIMGETIPVNGDFFCYTKLEPIGVCGIIIPWNFPVALFANKVAPALAAGCTVVVKPAEQTPLSTLALAPLIKEAGFPPGVINILSGDGPVTGASISEHMDIDKVSFTGSTEVGCLIQQASGRTNLKKVTLELGGKSPNIVFADAELDFAVSQSHNSVMANMGQVCCAGSRTYVQDTIYDEFVKKSVEAAKKRTVGNPLDGKNENGAQIDETQTKRIMDLIKKGKEEGAKLLTGGNRISCDGCFVEPTVFSDVSEDMTIAKEEIFGPVQSIFKFKTIDEVIKRANNTKYGLAASVFTKDVDKAHAIANGIEAGTVWVNHVLNVQAAAPFGGYKMSGIGREMGFQGVKEFLQTKTVYIRTPADPKL